MIVDEYLLPGLLESIPLDTLPVCPIVAGPSEYSSLARCGAEAKLHNQANVIAYNGTLCIMYNCEDSDNMDFEPDFMGYQVHAVKLKGLRDLFC